MKKSLKPINKEIIEIAAPDFMSLEKCFNNLQLINKFFNILMRGLNGIAFNPGKVSLQKYFFTIILDKIKNI